MATFQIEHNGYFASIEYREGDDNWKPSWWLKLDGHNAFPIGQKDASFSEIENLVRSSYIGSPPPSDFSKIWKGYRCNCCGVSGVKLWRDYQATLEKQTLRCRACCEVHEGKEKSSEGDSIGWSVPAVPTPSGSTFWGYTSVPIAAMDWWNSLPTKISCNV